jgi:quercetin dioxygenase-like cupin family protein
MRFCYILIASLLVTTIAMATKKPAPPPTEVEITAEPHHQLIFHNEYVRVYDVVVTPKDATLPHNHRHDYVYVVMGAAEISNEVKGKDPVKTALADGDVKFVEGGFTHVVRNVGATPFHNITVELLQDEKTRNEPASKWNAENAIRVLGGAEDVLFVKDGVRVARVQLETAGFEHRHHHAGPHLGDCADRSDSALRDSGQERHQSRAKSRADALDRRQCHPYGDQCGQPAGEAAVAGVLGYQSSVIRRWLTARKQ